LSRRTTLWLAVIVAAALFVTVIPTAWATPSESPLNQTVPTIPTPSPGDGGSVPPPPPPIPYGGYLYYYVFGYGGTPNNFYPGYWTGNYWYPHTYNFYYPGGMYTPAYPIHQGYQGNQGYYGIFW
jgi:hypothetical protein